MAYLVNAYKIAIQNSSKVPRVEMFDKVHMLMLMKIYIGLDAFWVNIVDDVCKSSSWIMTVTVAPWI